jgi:hypothetical protein
MVRDDYSKHVETLMWSEDLPDVPNTNAMRNSTYDSAYFVSSAYSRHVV